MCRCGRSAPAAAAAAAATAAASVGSKTILESFWPNSLSRMSSPGARTRAEPFSSALADQVEQRLRTVIVDHVVRASVRSACPQGEVRQSVSEHVGQQGMPTGSHSRLRPRGQGCQPGMFEHTATALRSVRRSVPEALLFVLFSLVGCCYSIYEDTKLPSY